MGRGRGWSKIELMTMKEHVNEEIAGGSKEWRESFGHLYHRTPSSVQTKASEIQKCILWGIDPLVANEQGDITEAETKRIKEVVQCHEFHGAVKVLSVELQRWPNTMAQQVRLYGKSARKSKEPSEIVPAFEPEPDEPDVEPEEFDIYKRMKTMETAMECLKCELENQRRENSQVIALLKRIVQQNDTNNTLLAHDHEMLRKLFVQLN